MVTKGASLDCIRVIQSLGHVKWEWPEGSGGVTSSMKYDVCNRAQKGPAMWSVGSPEGLGVLPPWVRSLQGAKQIGAPFLGVKTT